MTETLRVARLFFVLLVLVAAGRWIMGIKNVPYQDGHHYFSIVILTAFSCLYYGAFTRRWLDYRMMNALMLGVVMGLTGQILIVLLTVVSYAFGLETYFNNPRAVMGPGTVDPVPLAAALVSRGGGLIANTIGAGIVACLGWALGGLLPRK